MATLQVKNVPEPLHQRLRGFVQAHQCTLSDFILAAIERELGRREWEERFATRSTAELGVSAAFLLDQERAQRADDVRD